MIEYFSSIAVPLILIFMTVIGAFSDDMIEKISDRRITEIVDDEVQGRKASIFSANLAKSLLAVISFTGAVVSTFFGSIYLLSKDGLPALFGIFSVIVTFGAVTIVMIAVFTRSGEVDSLANERVRDLSTSNKRYSSFTYVHLINSFSVALSVILVFGLSLNSIWY